jgi:hypothetical protein
MPTRKQRRRQQKTRRHEWEYVYVDDDGNEVDVDPEPLTASNGKARPKERKSQPAARAKGGRPARTIQPPSWRRVGKRALMIGPVVVIAMLLLNRKLPLGQRIVPAIVMLAFFLPFSYFTDSLAYRMFVKRQNRAQEGAKARRS